MQGEDRVLHVEKLQALAVTVRTWKQHFTENDFVSNAMNDRQTVGII